MSKHITSLFFISISLLLTSCGLISELRGLNEEVEEQLKGELTVNVTDAKILYMTKEVQEGYTSNLFKMTTDGTFQEVTFVRQDEFGNIALDEQAEMEIFEYVLLGDSYLYLNGSFHYSEITDFSADIVVDLRDGSFASIDDNSPFYASSSSRLGEIPVQADASGNLYYSGFDGELEKMAIDGVDDISASTFLPGGQRAVSFSVDAAGNCMYEPKDSDYENMDLRIRKANGGIELIEVDEEISNFWLGADDHFYFSSRIFDNEYLSFIYKVVIDGGEISYQLVWNSDNKEDYYGVGDFFSTSNQGHHRIQKENMMLFVDTFGGTYEDTDNSWEFDETTNTVNKITHLPLIKEGSIIVNSANYYYIATGSELYKVDLYTHQVTKLLNAGDFEIYHMVVDAEDNLQFYGLRYEDGKLLLVNVDAAGSAQAMDPSLTTEFKKMSLLK